MVAFYVWRRHTEKAPSLPVRSPWKRSLRGRAAGPSRAWARGVGGCRRPSPPGAWGRGCLVAGSALGVSGSCPPARPVSQMRDRGVGTDPLGRSPAASPGIRCRRWRPSPLPAAHTGVWGPHLSGLGFPSSPGQGLLDDSDESYGSSPSKLAHVRFELCAPFPGSPAVQCGPRFEIMAPSCLLHWGNLWYLQSHNLTFSLLRVLDRRLRGLCERGLGFSLISVAQVHATLLC